MLRFIFEANEKEKWGLLGNFDNWKNWYIKKVYDHGQGKKLGIKANWKIIKINGFDIHKRNCEFLLNILKKGQSCRITFIPAEETNEVKICFLSKQLLYWTKKKTSKNLHFQKFFHFIISFFGVFSFRILIHVWAHFYIT